MKYSKPQLDFIGYAKNAIEGAQGSKGTQFSDGLTPDDVDHIGPAYDLDE